MASTQLLISVLLTASQTQGQCPLSNCSLANQVNICTNGGTTVCGGGGCSESLQCVMALRQSATVDECCNKITESLTTNAPPTSGQSGDICGVAGAQTLFGDTLDRVNTARSFQGREIHEGTYIVHQVDPDFIYNCNGCIKSLQLTVNPNSELKNSRGEERIKFHTFTVKMGNSDVFQRKENAIIWNSMAVNTTVDRKVVEYRPIGMDEVCFNRGDVFGFTIEAGSDITVLTRFPPDTRIVLNVSNNLQTISGCPQLNNSHLYMTTERFSLIPLIHIITGGFPLTEPPMINTEPSATKPTTPADSTIASPSSTTPDPQSCPNPTEPPMTTTESSSTKSVTPTDSSTTASSSSTSPNPPPPTNPTDVSTGGVLPPAMGYVIYAAGGFAGAMCILLIVVIIVVVIYIVQRRKHKSYQHGNGFKFGSPIPVDNNAAYGVSADLYEDGDHLEKNAAYGVSDSIDHIVVDSNNAYGTSEIGYLSCGDKNEAYGVILQQTDTLQKFDSEDDTPHIYECPDSMMETKPN